MADQYRWIVGLGNDELGYVVPLSDYRVSCVADAFAGPGTCAALHAAGVIEFPDAIAGATCKAVTEDPSLLAAYGPAAEAVAGSCRYGQAFGEADGHYGETNSVGWDLEADILAAVADAHRFERRHGGQPGLRRLVDGAHPADRQYNRSHTGRSEKLCGG